MNSDSIRPNSLQAWILACRPQTLPAAAAPILIGTGLLLMNPQTKLAIGPTFICFGFALLMQIASNLINDLFDFLKGTDREDRLGPKRCCAQGWITPKAMKWGIFINLLLAALVGSLALLYAYKQSPYHGLEFIFVGILCMAFAFFYTTGPYPLSYQGWGDVLVMVFFGFIPVGGTYWIQTYQWTPEVTIAALVCGMVVDTLLVLNNYRDRAQDLMSGKKTVVVRFGEPFGRYLYGGLGIFACWMCLAFLFGGHLFAALLPQFYLFFHFSTWRKMIRIRAGRELNAVLGLTGRNIFIFALLLFAGMALA